MVWNVQWFHCRILLGISCNSELDCKLIVLLDNAQFCWLVHDRVTSLFLLSKETEEHLGLWKEKIGNFLDIKANGKWLRDHHSFSALNLISLIEISSVFMWKPGYQANLGHFHFSKSNYKNIGDHCLLPWDNEDSMSCCQCLAIV